MGTRDLLVYLSNFFTDASMLGRAYPCSAPVAAAPIAAAPAAVAWQRRLTVSPANVHHGSVLLLGQLKHACMGCLLLVNCSGDDEAQILIGDPRPHSIPQTHLIGAKQADLQGRITVDAREGGW